MHKNAVLCGNALSPLFVKAWFICRHMLLYTLPNDKFLDWLKLKAFADDKINVT